MNEEELKKGCGKSLLKTPSYCLCGDATDIRTGEIAYCPTCQARLEGFQKGKLEQKKEDIGKIEKLKLKCWTTNQGSVVVSLYDVEQLQKEIGGMK